MRGRASRADVLVTSTAYRGFFDCRRYGATASAARRGRAYRAVFRRFDHRYPWVRAYAARYEVNHIAADVSRPCPAPSATTGSCGAIGRSRGFRVLAAQDVLDTADLHAYLRAFLRLAPGRPRSGACTTTRT